MHLIIHIPSFRKDPEGLSERERELKNLKEQFHDDFPVGPLIGKCCTMDQVHVETLSILISSLKIYSWFSYRLIYFFAGKSCHNIP